MLEEVDAPQFKEWAALYNIMTTPTAETPAPVPGMRSTEELASGAATSARDFGRRGKRR